MEPTLIRSSGVAHGRALHIEVELWPGGIARLHGEGELPSEFLSVDEIALAAADWAARNGIPHASARFTGRDMAGAARWFAVTTAGALCVVETDREQVFVRRDWGYARRVIMDWLAINRIREYTKEQE